MRIYVRRASSFHFQFTASCFAAFVIAVRNKLSGQTATILVLGSQATSTPLIQYANFGELLKANKWPPLIPFMSGIDPLIRP